MSNNDIPAFPSHGTMGEVVQEGMTLRDWFASNEKTLPFDGWVSDYFNELGINGWNDLTWERKKEALVVWRYEMADAMIEAGKR